MRANPLGGSFQVSSNLNPGIDICRNNNFTATYSEWQVPAISVTQKALAESPSSKPGPCLKIEKGQGM